MINSIEGVSSVFLPVFSNRVREYSKEVVHVTSNGKVDHLRDVYVVYSYNGKEVTVHRTEDRGYNLDVKA